MRQRTGLLIVIVFIVFNCLVTLVQEASGHQGPGGSHQHMKNRHDHYVPKVGKLGEPVQSVLEEQKMIHDTEHLKEDLKDMYTEEQIKKMTPEELDFHYFKLHDYDNNERLDGLEVMAAISHVMPHDPDLDLGKLGEGHVLTQEQQRALTIAKEGYAQQINHFISMIDRMFLDNDLDKDGFINYREFVRTRRPDAMYKGPK